VTSLKQQALKGVKWTAAASFSTTLIQFLKIAILTRYLEASDFGLMAMAMVVIGFSRAFADMGISKGIIQKQEISDKQLSSLYWLNVFSGFFIFLLVALLAKPISIFYNEPQLTKILMLTASTFLIQSFGLQFQALIEKSLNFKYITISALISQILGLITSTVLAIKGFGVFSLVWAAIVTTLVRTFFLIFLGLKIKKPTFNFSLKSTKPFWSFGLYQMGEQTINYFSANIDKILIGKFLGMEAVGYYNLAWRLIIYPLTHINPIINRVAFPVFSKLQDNKAALSRYYCLSIHFLSLITVPILVFLFFYSKEVVAIVYGSNWQKTADLLQVLSLVGILKAIGNPGASIILAVGRADIGFWWNAFWAVFVSVGYYVTMLFYKDIIYVAYSLLIMCVITGWIWHYIIYKVARVDYYLLLRKLTKVVVAVFGLGYLSTFFSFHFEGSFKHSVFAAAFMFCAISYAIYIILLEKDLIKKIRGVS
jgi:O-antigen/teichoic acid export membrane protein